MQQPNKPNILVIWGDSIGLHDVSAYTRGLLGYRTPNIDQLAKDGAIFTDAYGEQSSTAGRAAFILGQHPFRTGLLKAGRPRSPHGIEMWMPTLADLLKPLGYACGHFGRSGLGDGDEHLPTAHGFDEFFGNLYDLDTEAEPDSYHYPKDNEFRRRYGPRGVIHSWSDADRTHVEDTGPLTRQRIATIDEEVLISARRFIERAVRQGRPFFVWMNSVNARSWAQPNALHNRETGISPYADGMVRHDRMVGAFLEQLDDLGVADKSIVVYSTDQGAGARGPNGGVTPFVYEEGTSAEGRRRVPLLARWPGVIAPETEVNDIISHMDWMPTLLAAAGEQDIREKLRLGHCVNGRTFQVIIDGYNFLPFLSGTESDSPRPDYLYFNDNGTLEAVRVSAWKVYLKPNGRSRSDGIVNLRANPYERAIARDDRRSADRTWVLVPAEERIDRFFKDFDKFPHQPSDRPAARLVYV